MNTLWQYIAHWWDDPFRRRSSTAEKITIILTLAIAIVGSVQARIYMQQKKIMESSGGQTDQLIKAANINACAAQKIAEASEKNATAAAAFATSANNINAGIGNAVGKLNSQAEAAKNAVNVARDQMRVDQRAWVGIFEITPTIHEDSLTVKIVLKNTGKTPAKDFRIWGAGEPVVSGQEPNQADAPLPGHGVIAPGGKFHSILSGNGSYTKSMILRVHGRIDYYSVFGFKHWTTFCYTIAPDSEAAPCESGNDIDNNPS